MKTRLSAITKAFLALLFTGVASSADITGHWSFEQPDLFLSARIGQPMQETDAFVGLDEAFGTTGVGDFAGVPNIGGQPVKVLRFPKTAPGSGYWVPNGSAGNGGGFNVNQYTIIADILFPTASSGKIRALFQTDSDGQAEFFLNSANQVGMDGGSFVGSFTPNEWHRLALAVDLAAATPSVAFFIDGVKVSEGAPIGGLDGRLSIAPIDYGPLLFDNDDTGDTEIGYLSSLQFRNERLSDAIIAALGAPTFDGIPTGPLPNPYLVSALPSPDSTLIAERSTVSPRPSIQAVIVDGTNAVNTSMVTMFVDGSPVAASVVKVGGSNTISFTPPGFFASLSTHTVRVNYKGLDGTPYTTQWQFLVGRYEALPLSGAAPPGSANTSGFHIRTAQAPSGTVVANVNSATRAIKQLNGTLTDTGGVLVANVAFAGPNSDGSYDADIINYHLTTGTMYGAFDNDVGFSGIPGSGAGDDLFATEVVGYLELPEGVHRLGVSVSVDRTDTGTDDGYTLFGGREARNVLSPVLGQFSRTVSSAFANLPNFNEFTVLAPTGGVYSFRIVHYQTLDDASLEFYSLEPGTTNRVLINDPLNPAALRAYRFSTASFANKPYVAEVSPRPGSSGVSPLLPLEVLILDDQTQVETASVVLSLNGVVVPRTVSKVGGRTTVFYQPNATRTEVTNRWRLVYRDNALPTPNSFTNDFEFTIQVSTAGFVDVTGQWDFDFCDLSATLGAPLEFFGGPNGQTATSTQFGSTTSFGIPDIGGVPASVMSVPGGNSSQLGYIMRHGIPANGGGSRVNQYTLIYDIFWQAGPGFASFINLDAANTSDGDFFFRVGDGGFGQGAGGYEGNTVMQVGRWHRVAFAVDMAATPPVVTKFLDGVKHADSPGPNNQLDGLRRTLPVEGAVLFGDEDGERHPCYVSSIQIREGKLSDGEIAALGGPSAGGIPVSIPATKVRGQWDFNFATGKDPLGPTVGKPLEYFDGPAGTTASGTQFGTTTGFAIPDIGGVAANVMSVPGGNSTLLGYIMRHGIAANGGGSRVNQYTLIYDIYWQAGPGFASFINMDVANTSDGDFFFRVGDGGFGQGAGGYEGNMVMQVGRWHRVAFAVDMAATPPVVTKFLDGVKHADSPGPNNQLDGLRRTLPVQGAVLFGDEDGERHPCYVNSVQIREGVLSDSDLAALGGPSAGGIPVVVPATGVKGQWDFNFPAGKDRLGPTAGKPLEYFDGPAGTTASGTQFGTTTDFGIPDIGGVPAGVMGVPGGNSTLLGYIMRHGIAANGGGSRVNQYTLVYDIYWLPGPGFASFINMDTSNTSDGDFFFRVGDGGFGQGAGGYEGSTVMMVGRWHRVAFAVDMAASPPVVTKFLDGVKHADSFAPNNQLDGLRRTLPIDGAVLFGDEDGERHPCYVNSIQVREGKLSDAELAALGPATASGPPVAIVLNPAPEARISFLRVGNMLRLAWPVSLTGYILESTPSLTVPNWQPVPGVVNNCANENITGQMRYYQLRHP